MVNFGARLSALCYEPWESQYLDYSRLKGVLEEESSSSTTELTAAFREREFVRQLNREIEKIVLFFLTQQGILAARCSGLRQEERECSLQAREHAAISLNGSEASATLTKLRDLSQQYTNVGEDLVHLIHYVELNVTGVRKILKKHDKLYKGNKLSDRYLTEHYHDATQGDSHLRQLLHYEGVGALVATLQESLYEIRVLKKILQDGMSERASSSHRHRRINTAPLIDMNRSPHHHNNNDEQLPSPWQPATPQTTTTKSPQPHEYAHYDDLFDDSQDLILLKINAARRRLHESSNFVKTLAAGELAMMEQRVSSAQDLAALGADEAAAATFLPSSPVSRISSFLNLSSTFLYMSGYYIVAPSSGHYASKLGGSEALAGLIIGMTPIAALLSTILYSWWTSHSYKAALIFASVCSIAGNLLYALGLPCNSIMLVMIGRLLNGFGSARSINRRYIADSFSRQERTAASAAFVTAGALGMAAGPAIAALLDVMTPDDDDNNVYLYWSAENAPGWFMSVAWTIYLVVLIVKFQDPPRNNVTVSPEKPTTRKEVEMSGEKRALLTATLEEEDEEKDSVTTPPALWRNIPVVMTLLIYFVLKLAIECCLSSTATLTGYYFDWGTQASGLYLAMLGLLIFPANLVVAYFSRQYEDRDLILAALWLLFLGVCGIINYGSSSPTYTYSMVQFITFGICIFVSCNALEAPTMSLLSKTIPTSWAKGLFNVGLLATEAGTLGRAVGDVFITWWGLDSISHLLNNMFVSLGVMVALTLAGTYRAFPFLEPFDKDDD